MADYQTMFKSFADFFEEPPTVSEPMKVTTTVACSSETVCAADTFISTSAPSNKLNPALVGIAVVVATGILFWPTSRAIRKFISRYGAAQLQDSNTSPVLENVAADRGERFAAEDDVVQREPWMKEKESNEAVMEIDAIIQ
ncbi:hypothetical protein F5878DRAFT_665640 [Lentinula raphanica]|uniref:Uncharacterized protein n=1 Tax=Lentinula raphanica TaxID=153919 RepID=A0AA38NZF1_9AGAR|nr:hypothetical protein F5878DRAFT_665640 [Lentinula raphanica]